MPAKKKAKKRKAAPKVVAPDVPEAMTHCEADFPCDESKAFARELLSKYGQAFGDECDKHAGSAIPISLLRKVIEPTLRGKPPKMKANKSFKDRGKE